MPHPDRPVSTETSTSKLTRAPRAGTDPVKALLACLGASPGDGVAACARLDVAGWRALTELARGARVGALLYRRLRQAGVEPPDCAAALRVDYVAGAVHGLRLYGQLGGLLRELGTAGVPVLVVKGAHLAAGVYGDAAVRPMEDIDLLVPPDRLRTTRGVLERLGYVSGGDGDAPPLPHQKHLPAFRRPGAFPVEVHWRLSAPVAPYDIDTEGLFRRAREIRLSKTAARVLSPEDLLLHLCVHAAYDHGFRAPLQALCDITAVVTHHAGDLDWAELVARANADGRGRFTYMALRLARETLAAGVPEEALAALAHMPTDDEVVRAVRRSLPHDSGALSPEHRDIVERAAARGVPRVLWRALFPSANHMRACYDLPPGSTRLLLYRLYRPVDLVRRHMPTVARMILRRWSAEAELLRERSRVRRWLRGGRR